MAFYNSLVENGFNAESYDYKMVESVFNSMQEKGYCDYSDIGIRTLMKQQQLYALNISWDLLLLEGYKYDMNNFAAGMGAIANSILPSIAGDYRTKGIKYVGDNPFDQIEKNGYSRSRSTISNEYTEILRGTPKTDFYVAPNGTALKAADYKAINANIPKTRLDVHNDLLNKGYTCNGTSQGGYVTYAKGDLRVDIRPDGEVICTQRVKVNPNDTSWNAKKYSQRQYYDGTPVPNEGHNTYQYVESIDNATIVPPKPNGGK
jgi:hypothetical protein